MDKKNSKPKKQNSKANKEVKDVKKAPVVVNNWEGKSVKELRLELQKLHLEVKTAKEQNTSLIRKLKKHIARKLTKANSKL